MKGSRTNHTWVRGSMGGSGRAEGLLVCLAVTAENTRLPETETNCKKDGGGWRETSATIFCNDKLSITWGIIIYLNVIPLNYWHPFFCYTVFLGRALANFICSYLGNKPPVAKHKSCNTHSSEHIHVTQCVEGLFLSMVSAVPLTLMCDSVDGEEGENTLTVSHG